MLEKITDCLWSHSWGMRTLERLGVHEVLSEDIGFRGP